MAERMRFDSKFFEQVLNSSGVDALCEVQALAAEEIAVASAPVESGDYRDGIKAVRARGRDRVKWIVIGQDWKTLLVESQTGNLARALKAVKKL